MSEVLQGAGNVLSSVGGGLQSGLYYAQLADAIYTGRLPQFLAAQSTILQDPTMRQRIQGSPGLARLLGVPVQAPAYPSAPSGFTPEMRAEEFGPAATAPRPQLPPLSLEGQVGRGLARAELGVLGQAPELAGRAGLGIRTPVPQPLEYPDFQTAQQAGAQAGLVPVPTNRGTFMLRRAPPPGLDPAMLQQLLQYFGIDLSGGGAQAAPTAPSAPQAPSAAPAPQAVPSAAAPTAPAPALPPPDTRLDQLPEGRVGYPSPAFQDEPVVQTPRGPLRTPVTNAEVGFQAPKSPVQAPAGAPPPGTSMGLRLGPLTIRKAAPHALPAVVQRQLELGKSASNAARRAAEIVRQGPREPLMLGGEQPEPPYGPIAGGYRLGGPPAHFTGVLRGPASKGAARFLGGAGYGPEAAQLEALLAHSRTAVFGIIGQRPNADSLAMFEPLMPDMSQQTGVILVHLDRLATFYEQLAGMGEEMSAMTPEQKLAVAHRLFQQTMTSPGESGEPPPVLDMR